MLKAQMYVRCSIDQEYPDEPRDFITGKIVRINDFAETAEIEFHDLNGLNEYYNTPEDMEMPLHRLKHCRIQKNVLVGYNGAVCRIVESCGEDDEGFYCYYIIRKDNSVIKASERYLKASFNTGEISPLKQLKQYEFQNPVWYLGRSAVNRTIHTIDGAFYGFKELAGCKISLKPYQLKTVMRCLSENNCRYMIADEVGLGKTIEAASVLKIYLSDKKNRRVLVCVPDALTEQWKTELAFKFRLFDGENPGGNIIDVLPLSRVLSVNADYDFIVIDEIHSILSDTLRYVKILRLSRAADNVIMLSATPVQSRNEEYHKLLSLIQPDKYYGMSEEDFQALLELQNKIVRKVRSAVEYLSDYKEVIAESEGQHCEDTRDAFDELAETLEDIAERTNDSRIAEDIERLDYDAENFSVMRFEKIVAYICEAYQLERCVIRNRKKPEDTNTRTLKELPYEMDCDFNNTEFRTYTSLAEWIPSMQVNDAETENRLLTLINAFFSSAAAFADALKGFDDAPEDMQELVGKWKTEEAAAAKNIRKILDDPYGSMSRMVTICNYLEQEAYNKKVLIFTHFPATFKLYRSVIGEMFQEGEVAFFCSGMSSDELELNTYRFQNDEKCRIMLSDETGGEGRNFQISDELICIDIPWSANTLEQRIGRLDRIGRDKSKDVVSVIPYSSDTVEHDLFDIWNSGLNIFGKSQSGLEIIMNDIDDQIRKTLIKDFSSGLSAIVEDMISEIKLLEKRVKEERHFDIAAYQFQSINQQIERVVEKYNAGETELFRSSMMSWASLAGFKGKQLREDIVSFNASSFSRKSAYNTLFVPPDMKAVTEDKLNKMQNHIRSLNGDKEIQNNPNTIQGTFNRALALRSDYLHFFAPGDDIFDSIVNNAVSAYKGKCAAFAIESPVEWEGFIFNWYMTPDELQLLRNNIPLKQINQYRGFISSEILTTYVSAGDITEPVSDEAKKVLKTLHQLPLSKTRRIFANYGKRSPERDFLGICEKYDTSNLMWFREKYPEAAWLEMVEECSKAAKAEAVKEFSKRLRIKALSETINKELSAAAASEYFGITVDIQKKKECSDIILNAFKKPRIMLDSVCYIRMIKHD